jgi:hypothetical protein
MYYHAASGKIFDANGGVLMGDVVSSDLTLETKDTEGTLMKDGGGLLTISITTSEDMYSTSVYSRLPIFNPAVEKTEEAVVETISSISESDSRKGFLTSALQAINDFRSGALTTGEINHVVNPNWPADTPWCASFIAWLMAPEENGGQGNGAGVLGYEYGDKKNPLNTGYVKGYYDYSGFTKITSAEAVFGLSPAIQPGDLVFFDWDMDGSQDHIGIVAYMGNGYLYTVEGNSGGIVAMRHYRVLDPVISGYRVIPWIND